MKRHSQLYLIPAAVLIATPAAGHEYLTLQQAQAQFFPGEKLKKQSLKLNDTQVAAIMKMSGVGVYRREVKSWRAKNGDVMVLDQVLGRQDVITYVVVFDAKGAVKAVEVLVCESGYEGVRAPTWLAQFIGKTPDTMKVLSSPSIISGTTLSCVNIAEGVMRLIATYKIALAKP